MKVRGIRIELEALEQAIMELSTVKHCEDRAERVFKRFSTKS